MANCVIDPGHGPKPGRGRSSQYGSRGTVLGVRECDVNWRLACALARRLGRGAALTRAERDNPSLAERAARARGGGCFLSLHANSGRPGQRGSEIFVHPRAGARSLEFARAVQAELRRLGSPVAEVSRAEMAVLRPEALGADVAACLVEVDYLSDPAGERRLGDGRSIDLIAAALARAVADPRDRPRYGRTKPAARALDEIPPPVFDPADPAGWMANLRIWMDHRLKFSIGVTDATIFPHSAICFLDLGGGRWGTGFYVSPSRIVTAGHIAQAAATMRILPGRTGANQIANFSVLDPVFFHPHPSFTGANDFDIGVVEVPVGPKDGRYFAVEEQRASPIGGIAECGYAGDEQTNTVQHCDTGSIVEVLAETYTFDVEDRHGSSGSPVFYVTSALDAMATGVGIAGWRDGGTKASDAQVNIGCRFTDAKIEWIWSLGFSLYFDKDSAVLGVDDSTTASLAQLVDYLSARPGKQVDIEGHASPEGDDKYNTDLSTKRAEALEAYLSKQGLGDRVRIVTGRGAAVGRAHSAAEFPGDRRAVALPVV